MHFFFTFCCCLHACVSGLGCVPLLLLLDGGDGEDLGGSQGVLCSTGQLPGARWRRVSHVLYQLMILFIFNFGDLFTSVLMWGTIQVVFSLFCCLKKTECML